MTRDIDDSDAEFGGLRPLSESSDASAAGTTVKICCVCGADVTRKKRMRDADGLYWCYECGVKDTMKKHPIPCDECGEPFPEFELAETDGVSLCPKCALERRMRAKREAARIAAAEQAEREMAERRRKFKLLCIAAACLVAIYAMVQGFVWLMLR